ncbi:ribonuclease T2 family protein [Oharaeibacter diazotrophicus]|uniref:Ribonuclease T2 n=1 Tax=Oharaeibacter diazotrophicus TaxID=1920512 RepID=A0A4R6RAG6_9HYPH|nr:ribonuclease T2 [Oharaeibacter diazotrophicus]TDP82636.1 ribonuclease T2 [Oharaeibacter diazotrophicus]BBE72600.1 ribonuclease I precursor [Pleomorphomonas sp. SM30]GLS76634.1 ribonuclease [Oharaeibacter diazotrophicus]
MTSAARRAVAAAALAATVLAPAAARADGKPGDFDFYVLALSWSPSYCEAAADDEGSAQCDGGRPYAFVVHGLWPQYDRGYPDFCAADRRDRPSRDAVEAMLDIMPDPGLVRHEWAKHGTCSGLSSTDYLALVRRARAAVTVPAEFAKVDRYRTVAPAAVERAFRDANPGLAADGVAVTCDGRRLREVRICLTRDLAFTDCREVDARGCRKASVTMPPVR